MKPKIVIGVLVIVAVTIYGIFQVMTATIAAPSRVVAEIDLGTLQRLREEKQAKTEASRIALDEVLTPRTRKRLQR